MAGSKVLVFGALAVVAIGVVTLVPTYNGLIQGDQAVQFSYAQVQNVLNRQFNTIKGMSQVANRYAEHEQNTMVGTAQGRGGGVAIPPPIAAPAATKASTTDIANNPELQKQLAQSDQAIQGYMVKINSAVEAYPDLKANTQFENLMKEMEGSANRVSVERRRNQQAVMNFNSQVLHFPGVLAAKLTGYHAYPYYQAAENQQEMPEVFQK